MKHFYRLESFWSDWWGYFGQPLLYTGVRPTDEVEAHVGRPPLAAGQAYCGLWLLGDWADAVRFWQNEPFSDGLQSREQAALDLLRGRGSLTARPFRVFTRVASSAFVGDPLWPDRPLVHLYPSSRFHLRAFDSQGKQWHTSEVSSLRVLSALIDDRHVDVLCKGRWRRKGEDLGLYLRTDVLAKGSVSGFLENLF